MLESAVSPRAAVTMLLADGSRGPAPGRAGPRLAYRGPRRLGQHEPSRHLEDVLTGGQARGAIATLGTSEELAWAGRALQGQGDLGGGRSVAQADGARQGSPGFRPGGGSQKCGEQNEQTTHSESPSTQRRHDANGVGRRSGGIPGARNRHPELPHARSLWTKRRGRFPGSRVVASSPAFPEPAGVRVTAQRAPSETGSPATVAGPRRLVGPASLLAPVTGAPRQQRQYGSNRRAMQAVGGGWEGGRANVMATRGAGRPPRGRDTDVRAHSVWQCLLAPSVSERRKPTTGLIFLSRRRLAALAPGEGH